MEVTHLVIPGENDRDDDFRRLVDWLAGLDPYIPLNLSRYHRDGFFVTAVDPDGDACPGCG